MTIESQRHRGTEAQRQYGIFLLNISVYPCLKAGCFDDETDEQPGTEFRYKVVI